MRAKAVNELLWARRWQHDQEWRAREGRNPDEAPPPLSRDVPADLRDDPRVANPPNREVDGERVTVADVGDQGRAGSNCGVMLRGVISYSGNHEFPPGDYRYHRDLTTPGE